MNRSSLLFMFSCAAFVAVWGMPSFANTGEIYGYGSRARALGNTMLGGIQGGYGAYYNPAANSALPGLTLSWGLAFGHPSFLDIKNVTTANSATTAETKDLVGDVDTSNYLDYFGQALGVNFNFGEGLKNFSVGLTAFMPVERLAYIDSGEPFLPEYFSYRSRTQRPQIYAAASATPVPHLHLATGLAIATNLSATTTATASSPSNTVSYQRFASTIKPSVSPYFSIYGEPLLLPVPLQWGLTVRLPNRYKVSIDTTANARLLGPTGAISLLLNSGSSIYYDPLEADLAAAYQVNEKIWLTAEADWLQYKAFESPSLTVVRTGGLDFNNSISNLPTMQNIVIPKIGAEYRLNVLTLRSGFYYRPSPVSDNSRPGNLVDPAQYVVTAGFGADMKEAKITDKNIVFDFDVQYHGLIKKHISKSPGNETGTPEGQTKIGSPGYDIGGHILGAGFSLTMSF